MCEEDDPNWVSMLQTGISNNNFGTLAAGLIPPKNAAEIGKLIVNLRENIHERNEIMMQLINAVLTSFDLSSTTRADYMWYLQFTFSVLLLKDLPLSFCALQGHLLTKCFSLPTTIWDSDPVKMDYFASNLYDRMENDKNLIFVTSQIENRSTFGFHLSLCLLWKSIYRCIGEEKSIFRLYHPSDLIAVMDKISMKELSTDFETVLKFIVLHSKIASLIFHRKHRSPHYKCLEEFFAYDLSLIKAVKVFLEKMQQRAESMLQRHITNLNYITMIEYLLVDNSEFDELIRNEQKKASLTL